MSDSALRFQSGGNSGSYDNPQAKYTVVDLDAAETGRNLGQNQAGHLAGDGGFPHQPRYVLVPHLFDHDLVHGRGHVLAMAVQQDNNQFGRYFLWIGPRSGALIHSHLGGSSWVYAYSESAAGPVFTPLRVSAFHGVYRLGVNHSVLSVGGRVDHSLGARHLGLQLWPDVRFRRNCFSFQH